MSKPGEQTPKLLEVENYTKEDEENVIDAEDDEDEDI